MADERFNLIYARYVTPIIDEYCKLRTHFDVAINDTILGAAQNNIYELFYCGAIADPTDLHLAACAMYGPYDWRHNEMILFMLTRKLAYLPYDRYEHMFSEQFSKLIVAHGDIWIKEDYNNFVSICRAGRPQYAPELDALVPGTDIIEDIFKIWTKSNFALIQGAGGTGKTYQIHQLIKSVISSVQKETISVIVTAITNLAVENVRQVTRISDPCIEYVNIYSLKYRRALYAGSPSFLILIVDESSMVNEIFVEVLERIVRDGIVFRVLFVGDIRQLPPVRATSLFKIMLDKFHESIKINMTVNHRCSDVIIKNANEIWNYGDDEGYIDLEDFLAAMEINDNFTIVENNLDLIGDDVLRESMIITYNNDDVNDYNRTIAARLRAKDYFADFTEGDKCICLDNYKDKKIYNNSMCTFVSTEGQGAGNVIVKYRDELKVIRRDDVKLAYVITIHKSQGQQSDTVIILLRGKRFECELLNTAITRSKQRVIIMILDD